MKVRDKAAVVAAYSSTSFQPTLLERYMKFFWAVVGVTVTLLLAVANNLADIMPPSYLAVVQVVVGLLSSLLVLRDSNALTPAAVVELVDRYLPGHTLISLADTVDVLGNTSSVDVRGNDSAAPALPNPAPADTHRLL